MLRKIKNLLLRNRERERIERRLEAIALPKTDDLVAALDAMLAEDRKRRADEAIGLINFQFGASRR